MATNSLLIRCGCCGAQNRVSAGKEKGAPVCGKCKTPLAPEARPVIVTDANYAAEVESSPLPVLLDLWAAWCAPCRMIAPVVEQIAREFAGKIRVGKLDVDQNPQTAARFNVQGIPTLLILKNGREIDRIVGAASKETILARLKNIVG